MKYSRIAGAGHYVPEQVVTNTDLMAYMETSDAWITERSGIRERRFFKEGFDTVSNMGAKASLMAVDKAGIKVSEVEMIVFATLSPDYNFPGSGVLMQRELGLKNIPALDIRMQCGGFIYALSVADQYIKTGTCKTVLVVGSEIQSNVMELSNRGRNMAVLFGDGAGAVVLKASDSPGILSTHLHSDGEFAEDLMLEHPGSRLKNRFPEELIREGKFLPHMNGQHVFKHAVQRFPEVIKEALEFNKLSPTDIDLLIPHQANLRIAEYVQQQLCLPYDKVYNNIQKYGNTTAASIPLAFSEAWEEGKVKEGGLICFAAFGSGFVWASALVRM
ncbi:MAG: 3-oxoacyl-ACP synthase III family protein [Cytophagaceae bacterium]